MKAQAVLDVVARLVGVAAKDFPDGGFVIGSPDDEVKGILVTWMVTMEALLFDVTGTLNLVICHEPFYSFEQTQPPAYRWTSDPREKPSERENHPNQSLREIAMRRGLTVLNIHYGLDRLTIYDDFAKFIGLGPCVAGSAYEKVYSLPRPMKLRELAEEVRQKMGLESVRVVGDLEVLPERAGNLWGGVALSSNRYWMRKQIENGAEVIICGECDEAAMMFATEYGVALIVTSHVKSENIGLANFTEILRKEFPKIPVAFYEVQLPYSELRGD